MMTAAGTDAQRQRVARRFHEQYEHLAPLYGWTTQEASAVDWEDVPEHQRQLMVHVVGNLLAEGWIELGEKVGGDKPGVRMTDPMQPIVKPGSVLRHSDGDCVVVLKRMDDNSGWLVHGGGGVSDYALASGDWAFEADSVRVLVEHRDYIAVNYVKATNPGIDEAEVKADRWARAVARLTDA